MKVNQCHNLSFDKRTGEPFCRSTHVCYRHFCKPCTSTSLGVKQASWPARLVFFGNVTQLSFDFESFEL